MSSTIIAIRKQAVSVTEEVSLKNDKRSISVVEYNAEHSKWSTEHGIFSGQIHVLKLSLGKKWAPTSLVS